MPNPSSVLRKKRRDGSGCRVAGVAALSMHKSGTRTQRSQAAGALAGDGKSEWLPVYQAVRDSSGLISDQVLAGSKGDNFTSITLVGAGWPRECARADNPWRKHWPIVPIGLPYARDWRSRDLVR